MAYSSQRQFHLNIFFVGKSKDCERMNGKTSGNIRNSFTYNTCYIMTYLPNFSQHISTALLECRPAHQR